eukprot:13128276-Ditylum_brightwellii.AAC.1
MKGAKDGSDVIEKFFWKTDANNSGNPLNSDCKADNDTVSDLMGRNRWNLVGKDVDIPEPGGK